MDPDRAKEIIRTLADGRDPVTGAQFPPNSPYQQADTVRALFMAVDALDNAARRARSQAARSERAAGANLPGQEGRRPVDPNRPKLGTAWTPEEEAQLREGFAAHKPIQEIAAVHGRNVGGISARLVKLGLIDAPATHRAVSGNKPSIGSTRPTSPIVPASRPAPQMPGELTEKEKDDFPF